MDLIEPPETPDMCRFIKQDILALTADWMREAAQDPELGIKLFNHTRALCEASGVPYVMENVRCAEQFVGRAQAHAGSFYLWGTAVPPLLPKRLIKMGNQGGYTKRGVFVHDPPGRRQPAHKSATIPPELANCVADYAERLLEAGAGTRKIGVLW